MMDNIESKKEVEEKEPVDALLELPVKNLEGRIGELESEIRERRSLKDQALIHLGNHQLSLREKLRQMQYASALGFGFSRKVALEIAVTNLESRKLDEIGTYVRDVSRLRERLREAREELAIEQEKQRLLTWKK